MPIQFPEHWRVVTIGDVFNIQQGKSLSPKGREGKSPFPFLRTSNVMWGELCLNVVDEMDFSDDEVARLSLMSGDLLVCEGGDIGRTAIWQGELPQCCYQNHLHRLRAKQQDIVPTFYMYWMQAALLVLHLYQGQENKTTIPNLSKSRLSGFQVPLPPPSEQRAIAHALRAVQQAKEARQRELALERERKAALMEHLFTHGTRNEPRKQTAIGEVPESWGVLPLGEVITLQRGYDLPEKLRQQGTFPVISSAGIHGTHSEPKTKGPGVVTGRYGSIGKVHYVESDFWPLNTTLFVSDFKDNHPRFITYLLYRLDWGSFNDKTSVPGVNRNLVHMTIIALPPYDEQVELAQILVQIG